MKTKAPDDSSNHQPSIFPDMIFRKKVGNLPNQGGAGQGLGDILSQRQIVPRAFLGRQNVPTYALMHMKVMESCWDILSPVKKAIGTICRK